jgi:hypothetical protein
VPFKKLKLDNFDKARIGVVAFGCASILTITCWGEFVRRPAGQRKAARAAKVALSLAYARAEEITRDVPHRELSVEPLEYADSVELRRLITTPEIARAENAYVLACRACADEGACERDRRAMESPATRTAVEFTPCE